MSQFDLTPPKEPAINADVMFHLDKVNQSGILNYRSDALPTWCPGCGYYGITLALTHALNQLNVENKNLVIVSGIGCAGRYPFFVNGYGFHTVHGRAVPIASGVKMANPDLMVIAVGGDGDGLGIGGGHLPHAIRRNIDITYILFDNGIYGLTKGQASPTTPNGQITHTTPYGNPDHPINPILLGLSYRVSFLGAGYAGLPHALTPVFTEALRHRGFSLVIVTTPCITFDRVNITYDRYRDVWKPVPPTHNISDLKSVMALAMDGNHYHGVLYREERPTWSDTQSLMAIKANKKHA